MCRGRSAQDSSGEGLNQLQVGRSVHGVAVEIDLGAAEGALDASLLLQYRRGRGGRGDPAQVEGAPFALSLGAGFPQIDPGPAGRSAP